MHRRTFRGGRASLALALLALLTFAIGSAEARPLGRSATVNLTMCSSAASKAGLDLVGLVVATLSAAVAVGGMPAAAGTTTHPKAHAFKKEGL